MIFHTLLISLYGRTIEEKANHNFLELRWPNKQYIFQAYPNKEPLEVVNKEIEDLITYKLLLDYLSNTNIEKYKIGKIYRRL